jgi:Na+-translocating ferredoxin:NAD+ oxidoreductase RnfE subunit
MNFLCKYSNIFGMPNQGVHKLRIPVLDIALVDTVLTIIAAIIISHYTSYNFLTVFIILIIVGIIVHKLFCVRTKLNNLIFD